ncbi:hypothetical protein SI65_05842 [Aspergillus cristatus]|uniref:Uncharacterized protein n=1 Tax=Aspergillus cristatus TaxID=573508 RepID=A0A1E3BE17_ASPCR|nr:hypothetical protein SI65_05842 [Aspergillus cristatus]
MDLDFFVNRQHHLHCKQLASEINPDQDVCALYGLQSMIVLRDAANPLRRSVITTLGTLRYKRHGVHVNVKMHNDGSYARVMPAMESVQSQVDSNPPNACERITPEALLSQENLKRQQTVTWNSDLTVTIQHDAFKLVVDSIIAKLQRLWLFQANAPEIKDDEVWTVPHLRERAHWRRSVYERPEMMSTRLCAPADKTYLSRAAITESVQMPKA